MTRSAGVDCLVVRGAAAAAAAPAGEPVPRVQAWPWRREVGVTLGCGGRGGGGIHGGVDDEGGGSGPLPPPYGPCMICRIVSLSRLGCGVGLGVRRAPRRPAPPNVTGLRRRWWWGGGEGRRLPPPLTVVLVRVGAGPQPVERSSVLWLGWLWRSKAERGREKGEARFEKGSVLVVAAARRKRKGRLADGAGMEAAWGGISGSSAEVVY